jgi:hypothetical protein
MAKKQRQKLTDLGDISNNNNSVAARAVRETIFTILPVWFREQAEQIAAQTLQDGGGQTLEQQVAAIVGQYAQHFNVTVKQLEERVGRKSTDWTRRTSADSRCWAASCRVVRSAPTTSSPPSRSRERTS